MHEIDTDNAQRRLTAAATLLVEKGIIAAEELTVHAGGTFPRSRPIGPGRRAGPPQAFEISETVRVRNDFVSGHVRMPGYVRGRQGVVVAKSPPYPFPDAATYNMQVTEEPAYSEELWPWSSDEAFIHVGLFQSYLEKTG